MAESVGLEHASGRLAGPGADPEGEPAEVAASAPEPHVPVLLRTFGALILVDAAFYCFTWARVPDPVVPVQRIVVWVTLLVGVLAIVDGRRRSRALGLSPVPVSVRVLFAVAVSLVVVVLAGLPVHLRDFGFEPVAWLMDLVKYATCVGLFIAVFFALRLRLVKLETVARAVVFSSGLCVLVSYLMLAAYLIGFRYGDSTIFRAYGDAYGVWPTGSLLPRLVGPATEPQQLSIVFVTGLLLMVRSRSRLLWALAVAGVGVLFLSQSKFALVSALTVVVYAVVSLGLRRHWGRRVWAIAVSVAAALLVVVGLVSLRLPVLAMTLQQGASADAVQERLQNAGILTDLIKQHFVLGIGAGQYGIYRGFLLGTGPDPTYYPNDDYLKVFSELGGIGFVLFAAVFVILAVLLIRARLRTGPLPKVTVPFALGTALIMANMAIGYEMLHVFIWLNLGVLLFCAVGSPDSTTSRAVQIERISDPARVRSDRSRILRASAPVIIVVAVVLSLVTGGVVRASAESATHWTPLPAGSIDDADPAVQYSAGWRVESSRGPGSDQTHWSGTTGATAALRFHGSQVQVFGVVGPSSGVATVSVDGGPAYEVDFYAPTFEGIRRMWVSAPAAGAGHRLVLTVTGERNDASSGAGVTLAGFSVIRDASSVSIRGAAVELAGAWRLGSGERADSSRGRSMLRFTVRGAGVVVRGTLGRGATGTVALDGGAAHPISAGDGTLWASDPLRAGTHRIQIVVNGPAHLRGITAFTRIATIATPASSTGTTHGWKTYAGNPVMGKNWGTAFDLAAARQNGLYLMWFSWRPRSAIAYAQSVDGISWTAPRIVLAARPGTWEADVNRPAVIADPDGGWRMWYTGQNNGVSAIGAASSTDGIHWTRSSSSPVLTPTAWETPSVMNPSVIWDAATRTYKMWYSGGQTEEPNAIGYATSKDGRTWKRYRSTPVLQRDPAHPWEQDRVAGIQVVQQGAGYLAFYIGYRDLYTAAIGVARSTDGVHWTDRLARPIISAVSGTWNCDAVYKPFALYDSVHQEWRLWFNGRCAAPEQLGLAIHEGADPTS